MINRETNIEKDFAAGKGVTGVVVLNENYVPIDNMGGLTETEGESGVSNELEKEVSFPWKRVIILSIILIIIFIFLKTRRDDEDTLNKGTATVAAQGETPLQSSPNASMNSMNNGATVEGSAQVSGQSTTTLEKTATMTRKEGEYIQGQTPKVPVVAVQPKSVAATVKKAKVSKEKRSHQKRKAKKTHK